MIKKWRAHISNITALEYIETSKVLISGSIDCTIRLWSPNGMYIGTLGQDETWNLYDAKSYMHPHVPFDVLTHYKSMPDHEIIAEARTMEEVLLANRLIESGENNNDVTQIT